MNALSSQKLNAMSS